MKIGRNDPCSCGSGKKYKKCCLNKKRDTSFEKTNLLSNLESDFEYISPISQKMAERLCKYKFKDLVVAAFCLNLWRHNRSALAQGLSLNMALTKIDTYGTVPIQTYEELTDFYNDISELICITPMEDPIIDDYGEVFINHSGKSYPIIIGTGHQQVYGVMRFMQELTSLCGRDEELVIILEYISTIISNTADTNIAVQDDTIVYELPTNAFWQSIKALFENGVFSSQYKAVSQIMGYQSCPIEMRHFVKNDDEFFPLFNASILIDYYKVLLNSATEEQKSSHITLTINSFLENTYNIEIDSTRNRVLITPWIISEDLKERYVSKGLIFATVSNNRLLIAIDEEVFECKEQIESLIEKVNYINSNYGLRFVEPFSRTPGHGSYGIKVDANVEIVYAVVNDHTDVFSHFARLEGRETRYFSCTALDLIYILGFSENFEEIIDYMMYEKLDETQVFSIGGKSNHFLAWKEMHHMISSGAIDYSSINIHFNETDAYTMTHFSEMLCELPKNNRMFIDPLSWYMERSQLTSLGFNTAIHKGCRGFGGDIKQIAKNTYVFFAHNVKFFCKNDFSVDNHTALRTIDELNQRLFERYAEYIGRFSVLNGKTLQLLYMPWDYACEHFAEGYMSDLTKSIVYCDEYEDLDTFIIRYSIDPQKLLSLIQDASNRIVENTYLRELLSPLQKYCPKEYNSLALKLIEDIELKKTISVFSIEQHYYYSDESVEIEISEVSYAKAKKQIAKACASAGVTPGEYQKKEATKIVREIQNIAVDVFEKEIAIFDRFELHCMVLNYYAIQQNGMIMNAKRYSVFKDLDEEAQVEFEFQTRNIREGYRKNSETALYLLESNLSIDHCFESQKCSEHDLNYLLAFAECLVTLQEDADMCHHNDPDFTICVDHEYKVIPIVSDNLKNQYDIALLRKYSDKEYQIKHDEEDKAFIEKANVAFEEDTGINLSLFLSLVDYMQFQIVIDNVAKEIFTNVFEVERDVLENEFYNRLVDKTIDKSKISLALDFLILVEGNLKVVDGTVHNLLPIWEREKRNDRFSIKPLIMMGDKCVFSPINMNRVLAAWNNGILEWFLPYEKGFDKLISVIEQWKERYEDEMVQDIADMFREKEFDIVIPEVELCRRFPKENYPLELGDYDVFTIHKERKEIWIVESKVLQKVGSVYEVQMQQKGFFYSHKYDELFQRRIDYLKQNTDRVLCSFGVTDGNYRVIPYMVTNKVFSSKYKEIHFPLIAIGELQDILDETFVSD